METRLHFEAGGSEEDSVTFAITDGDEALFRPRKGKFVAVSVAEEHAVDSYNSTFECTFHLDETQAIAVRDWLNAHFPK